MTNITCIQSRGLDCPAFNIFEFLLHEDMNTFIMLISACIAKIARIVHVLLLWLLVPAFECSYHVRQAPTAHHLDQLL